MRQQGKREVFEAVLIAGLCAAVTALVNWGAESVKAKSAAIELTQKGKNRKRKKGRTNEAGGADRGERSGGAL